VVMACFFSFMNCGVFVVPFGFLFRFSVFMISCMYLRFLLLVVSSLLWIVLRLLFCLLLSLFLWSSLISMLCRVCRLGLCPLGRGLLCGLLVFCFVCLGCFLLRG